ncbi:MAG TPA: acyl-CoA synthetase [Usitatibacter sp.]|nr:acyl-CoA synthetase [Usitatibacter sp.]
MAAEPTPALAASAEWTRAAERGSLPLIRFMAWMSLYLGRPFTRILLRIIAAYFFVFGGASGRAVRGYLRRCLAREPTAAERYGVYFAFASTLHDRIYFIKDRFDLFEIEAHGSELFDDGAGALLLGAHHGSFEAMRACGRGLAGRRVVMAMYEENARQINGVLAAIDPSALSGIVPLGRVDSMLSLGELLDEGALVGVLADRTLGNEAAIAVRFLGEEAWFPTGPMRMAAALRRKVYFMAGLYRGGNRYEIRFEPLADFNALEGMPRAERDARVRAAVEAYAGRLEHYVRSAPSNWFNFFDFWKPRA